ncbi:hypothetical protein ACKWTF_007093 [Chironomus riparius]
MQLTLVLCISVCDMMLKLYSKNDMCLIGKIWSMAIYLFTAFERDRSIELRRKMKRTTNQTQEEILSRLIIPFMWLYTSKRDFLPKHPFKNQYKFYKNSNSNAQKYLKT